MIGHHALRTSPLSINGKHIIERSRLTCSYALHQSWRRRTHRPLSTIAAVLTPPCVFAGLVGALWLFKCAMMVAFQSKIIYMPSVPPFSRSEQLKDYIAGTHPVDWSEEIIESQDGTKLAIAIGKTNHQGTASRRRSVVLYLQGNGGSTPARLPLLSQVMRIANANVPITLVALSYRGYWKSNGRVSQRGLEMDAMSALLKCVDILQKSEAGSQLFVWGHSIGAGIGASLVSRYQLMRKTQPNLPPINGLILEAPFLSLRKMLIALYPHKLLPYRYLGQFLWHEWDNEAIVPTLDVPILMMLPSKDEVVPPQHGKELWQAVQANGAYNSKVIEVDGALHHEAAIRGRHYIAEFIHSGR